MRDGGNRMENGNERVLPSFGSVRSLLAFIFIYIYTCVYLFINVTSASRWDRSRMMKLAASEKKNIEMAEKCISIPLPLNAFPFWVDFCNVSVLLCILKFKKSLYLFLHIHYLKLLEYDF